jgi:hypothetical protein
VSQSRPDDWWVDWVRTRDIPTIVRRIRVIREGTPADVGAGVQPDPDGAMQLLGTFARYRETLLDLRPELESAEGFAPLDAAAVLSLAALTRPVEEAAKLAIEQWTVESQGHGAPSRLTDSIVHDVTAQRIVREVAVFIAECRREGQAALVTKALNAFVVLSSGRTSFDKALLCIALRAAGCADEASEMLRLTLRQAGAEASALPAAGSAGQVGVVAALHHLSPAETLVEDWVDQRVDVGRQERDIIALVARLLIAERAGDRELARHVGGTWKPHQLIGVCKILAGRAQARSGRRAVLSPPGRPDDYLAGRAQECLILVRGYAATRADTDLAEIIRLWHQAGELTGTLTDLLTDIVAGGPGSITPRPIEFLDSLQETLKHRGEVPGRCCRELNAAAAIRVSGRETGAEVAEFLGLVSRRDLARAAQAVNRQLTAPLRSSETEIGREAAVEKFVDYVKGLQVLPRASALTFWALRALSDPAAVAHAPQGWIIADIAARVYTEVLTDAGFSLLERCLENEQWLSGEDAADIVARVRLGAMHDDKRWYPLLSTTVGRWADTRRRETVVRALRRLSYDTDADAIIRSFQ